MKIWPIEFFAQVGSKLCLLLNKFSKMGKYFNISPNLVILLTSIHPHEVIINVLNGLFTASFPLFSSFQYSWQLTNVRYKRWLMTGFELRTSGVGSDCSTNWATRLRFFPHWTPLIRTMFQVPQKGLKNQVRRHFTLLVPFSVDSPLLTKQSCGKGALLSLQNPRPRIASISRQMG